MPPSPTGISRNFFINEQDIQLTNGGNGPVFATSIAQYEVHKRQDVRNLGSANGYILMLKHRIIVPSQSSYVPGPTSSTGYNNYPAILVNQVTLSANNDAAITLRQIFPQTLNSAVSTSTSSDDGTSSAVTNENSSGSSHTNVNTFGVSLSGGFFGDVPMGSLTADYSHSWEHSTFQSKTSGTTSGASHGTGAGQSMSIKDWSAYGSLDQSAINPTWIWGQSYPWDVIQYNQSQNGSEIDLPTFVVNRLLNGTLVLPPSQLSLFGIDFTMTATWEIDYPDGISEDETVEITHLTTSYTASHNLNGDTISAQLQTSSAAAAAKYQSPTLSLSDYSLIPLNGPGAGNGSAIGFTSTPFTYAPTGPSSSFKIVSPANTLQVTGTGFSPGMTTDFSEPVSLSLTFKISDYGGEYALLLMHWIGEGSDACRIAWSINGNEGVFYADATEGDGGQGNISSFALRNLDFTSINFHDYLVIGTNTITLEVTPANGKAASYTLFAAAIGQA